MFAQSRLRFDFTELSPIHKQMYAGVMIAVAFVVTQVGAIAMSTALETAPSLQSSIGVGDPTGNPMDIVVYAVLIALGVVAITYLVRHDYVHLLRYAYIGFSFFILVEVVAVTGILLFPEAFGQSTLYVWGAVGVVVGLVGAYIYATYSEWYVVDVIAILGAIVVVTLFSMSFTHQNVLLMLVVFALFDAYSVYHSGHMKEAAHGLLEIQTPAIIYIPYTSDFSVFDYDLAGPDTEDGDEDIDADLETPPATILGTGDIVIPSVLVVFLATSQSLAAPTVGLLGMSVPLAAIGAALGLFAGVAALQYVVVKYPEAHAGLPLLNGGTLLGYGVVVALTTVL